MEDYHDDHDDNNDDDDDNLIILEYACFCGRCSLIIQDGWWPWRDVMTDGDGDYFGDDYDDDDDDDDHIGVCLLLWEVCGGWSFY